MSSIGNAWLSHSDVQSLLDRAHRYRCEVYAETGAPPDQFLVNEDEYRLLQMLLDDEDNPHHGDLVNDEIELFAMRVCRPERIDWYRDNRYMEHFKLSRFQGSSIFDALSPISPLPLNPDVCRTECPLTPQREVRCPCGEVIWDLSPCLYPDDSTLADNHLLWARARANDVLTTLWGIPIIIDPGLAPRTFRVEPHGQPSAISDDLLPPLDDLDEELQCCGHKYPTHAAFMTHRREHREG